MSTHRVITDEEIAHLSRSWKARLDEEVSRSEARPAELRHEAHQFRVLAAVSALDGQRRAFNGAADRYELEAHRRSSAQP